MADEDVATSHQASWPRRHLWGQIARASSGCARGCSGIAEGPFGFTQLLCVSLAAGRHGGWFGEKYFPLAASNQLGRTGGCVEGWCCAPRCCHASPLAMWLWPRRCEGFLLICCAGPELLQQVWLVSPSAMHHPKPHGPGAQPRRAPQTLPVGWQVLARTLNSSCFWMRGRKTALVAWGRGVSAGHVAWDAFTLPFLPSFLPKACLPTRLPSG